MSKKKKHFQDRNKVKEQIKDQISLLDIAQEYGLTLVKVGRYYSLAEYDSVIIYPETNTFYRNSNGAGTSIFEFMKEFEECGHMDFIDVFNTFAPRIDPDIVLSDKEKEARQMAVSSVLTRQERTLKLKSQIKEDDTNKHMLAYLIRTRGIEPEILYDMIRKKVLMQVENEQGYRSIAFLGYDRDGFLVSASQRAPSANSRFMADFEGCDYTIGRLYSPTTETHRFGHKLDATKTLVCCEADIDMMSYASLLKMNGQDYTEYDYHSCGSANKYMALVETIKDVGYNNLIFAFDNDDAGKQFTYTALKKLLQDTKPDLFAAAEKEISENTLQGKDNHLEQEIDVLKKYLERGDFSVRVHVPKNKDFNQDLVESRGRNNLSNRISSAKKVYENEKPTPEVSYQER